MTRALVLGFPIRRGDGQRFTAELLSAVHRYLADLP